jgi:hypothetical protein
LGEWAAGSASVRGSQWGRTPGVGALRQGMRSAEGVRAGVELGVRKLILFC